jgi:transposase
MRHSSDCMSPSTNTPAPPFHTPTYTSTHTHRTADAAGANDTMTRHLNTEQRQRVRTLFYDGHQTKREIQRITGYTFSQIQSAIAASTAAPSPRSGRPTSMSADEERKLVELVTSNQEYRVMTWLELSQKFENGKFGLYAIRSTLRRHGFKRYSPRGQPLIQKKQAPTAE